MRKKMLWAMLLVPLMALSMVNVAKGQVSTLYFTPEVTIDPNMGIGSYLTIGLAIDYGDYIWGYQVDLKYNPNVLHGVSVDDAGFIGQLGGTTIIAQGQGFDDVNGYLHLYGAALFEKDPALCPSAGGILVYVTFEVVGTGSSIILTGSDTGVMNVSGRWIVHGLEIDPLFSNSPVQPELYVRRRNAVTYEAWQIGLVGTEETLYSRIENYGFGAATVRVTFRVKGPNGVSTYLSNEADIPAAPAKGVPGEAVVSASFVPGPPGKYYYSAILEYKDTAGMTLFFPYELVAGILGGEPVSKDVNVGFKVVTHM